MTNLNNLIQLIVNAMIRMEGEPSTSTNPGNLRGAPWLIGPAAPTVTNGGLVGGFWKPGTRGEGLAGMAHLVALHIAQGNTLRDFMAGHPGVYAGYAPGADDNKPSVYILNVVEWVKEGGGPEGIVINPDLPMWNYIEEEEPSLKV